MRKISPIPQFFTLPNGLTLIIEEDHSLPIATVQAWCATGSIHEEKHLGSGLSHLLEHLLFKGTERRPPGVIADEISQHGGYMNAFTNVDRTVYFMTLPSSGVDNAVDILADVMMYASLPLDEYNKEQEVIRREFAMKNDNPNILSMELLYRTVFQKSPLGEPVIGHLDIFNKLTRDEVMAYYKKRYLPSNLCFVVVGDVSPKKIKEQLIKLFEQSSQQSLAPVFIDKEPVQSKKRIARKSFSVKQSYLNIAWKAPSLSNPDAPAMEVLAGIFALGNNSLLKQEVSEKKELVNQLRFRFWTLYQNEALFLINVSVDREKRDEAEAEILHQIELFKTRGATAEEVERSKNQLLSAYWHSLASVDGRAFDYGGAWLRTGDPQFKRKYFEAISRITPEEVDRVAQQYLVEKRLTITSLDPLTPDKASIISQKNRTSCQCGCS